MTNKIATLTDIHFGRKNNSDIHNKDCVDFIDFFVKECVKNKVTHVIFMGDWFENRSAINIQTLEWSYKGLSKLNELGIPVYMIVGNHDLYRRTDRDTHSVRMFQELENITIVDKITELSIDDTDILIAPFLFHDEYPTLSKYLKKDYWFGHFEFKGFVLTGATYKLEHGPDPDNFKGPKQIFSGHFHKRQNNKNITYTRKHVCDGLWRC